MIFKIGTILALFSFSLFASGDAHGGNTDIAERTFNFLVFAGIVYYIVAEPLKNFLTGRTLSIENEFKRNESKLEESKLAREKAKYALTLAKRQASIIIADAKKEAQLISEKLEITFNNDIFILKKQQDDLQTLEESKMVKSVVDEEIKYIIANGNIGLDQDSLTKTLLKKVS